MSFLLLQTEINWQQWIGEGIAISMFGLMLVFILRVMPTWKEIKLAELKTREREAEIQIKVAESLGTLGSALSQLGTVTQSIAIEQRRATDTVQILQRVNAEEAQTIATSVDGLLSRMDGFEQVLEEQGIHAKGTKTNRS